MYANQSYIWVLESAPHLKIEAVISLVDFGWGRTMNDRAQMGNCSILHCPTPPPLQPTEFITENSCQVVTVRTK